MYFDTKQTIVNDDWYYTAPGSQQNITPCSIPHGAVKISLPHAWNETGWNYEKWEPQEPDGTAWYFKKISLQAAISDLYLKFEGVAAECEVFLNGKMIHHNLGAYKPFEFCLTDIKGDGKDLIAVKVTDKQSVSPLALDEKDPFNISPRYENWSIPMGSSQYAGGIWRNVWLVDKSRNYLETPQLKICGNQVMVDVKCVRASGRIECRVFDADGNKLEISSTQCINSMTSLNIKLSDPRQWHPLSPYLYRLETRLFDEDNIELQCIRQPLAFFDFRVRDSEFYVNGRAYFLRGQNGFPHCNIAHDREYIKKYVSKVKEQGVEISRFHTEPPSHAWLDECDKQGIMVIFEMPLHGSLGCYAFGNKIFAENALAEIRELVKEYRRHPSIAMWSLGNELIVGCERDIGLSPALFDVLGNWCNEVRKLDRRPIIANSGGDGVELVSKSVGDVDDVHQYGGWYTENLRELNNFAQFSRKNDMVFQPMIVTESVAAYTDNNGEFMIEDETDVRQRKVVALRLGKIKNLREESLATQAFILKEYAEAMWRLRKPDSNLGGYIPFGQYTWFFDPFDKEGLNEKLIWSVYRKIMSPVHIQFECWNRHLVPGAPLCGRLLLCHEYIALADEAEFTVEIKLEGILLYRQDIVVRYHQHFAAELELALPAELNLSPGKYRLQLTVDHADQTVAGNYLDFKIYSALEAHLKDVTVCIYDPADKMTGLAGNRLNLPHEIAAFEPENSVLIIGPYALDEHVTAATKVIRAWCESGGYTLLLEQNPGPAATDILATGVSVVRKTQPYWSRWAMNMVKHADRADICDETHPVFAGVSEEDMNWWNGDTYLAHNFLALFEEHDGGAEARVLSRIGNGLLPDELMPVKYEFMDSGYSPTMFEFSLGAGHILISSLLLGTKYAAEPVARQLVDNIIKQNIPEN